MSRFSSISGIWLLACGLGLALFLPLGSTQASAFKVLHTFQTRGDGAGPGGSVIEDGAGNLYGTTERGGLNRCSCGTVFRLAPDGTETVLYSFGGRSAGPSGGLIADRTGNLYGTTTFGGVVGGACSTGCGMVYKVSPSGKRNLIYEFKGGSDGALPTGGVIADNTGNLFGATEIGGTGGGGCTSGCGTVFKIAKGGAETVLYSFCSQENCADGSGPGSFLTLIADTVGNLYGTTLDGGGASCSCGTVFKLAPDGTETVLHSFAGGSDGALPFAGVVADSAGNLYGTTFEGGGTGCGGGGCGTIFKVAPDGTESVLHAFAGGSDGWMPTASLIMDKAGDLYGTTQVGGGTGCGGSGCGTVFKLAPDGTETVLHSFQGTADGQNPVAGLLLIKGNLYGTAATGGANNHGTVFTLRK